MKFEISALVKLGRLVKPCRIICVLNLTQLWHMSLAWSNAFHKSVIQKSRIGNVALGKPQLWRTKGSSMPMHKALMRITIMVILKRGQSSKFSPKWITWSRGISRLSPLQYEKTGHWYSVPWDTCASKYLWPAMRPKTVSAYFFASWSSDCNDMSECNFDCWKHAARPVGNTSKSHYVSGLEHPGRESKMILRKQSLQPGTQSTTLLTLFQKVFQQLRKEQIHTVMTNYEKQP